MSLVTSKTKLTLWISNDVKKFGKQWARNHGESLSKLVSSYLMRLKEADQASSNVGRITRRLSGVISPRKNLGWDYKKHLEKKYSGA